MKKIALVTGAVKGIGYEVCVQLAGLGYIVLMGSRVIDVGNRKAKELREQGYEIYALQLDVTCQKNIDDAVKFIREKYSVLDVLVNNAGIAIDNGNSVFTTPLSVIRDTYETNVYAPISIIQSFLPLLRLSEAGRIVNVGSIMGSLTFMSKPECQHVGLEALAYSSSKTALNAITTLFAQALKDTPIKVNTADPGFCATELTKGKGLRSAKRGAEIVVKLATLPDDGPSGGFYNEISNAPW